MKWLENIADEVERRQPEGEILIESGGSPSGTYHFGHIRELVICDSILLELRARGRKARHVYFVDDLDGLRKIPTNVSPEYERYLGRPLCDIPTPDGSDQSYADYFIQGLVDASKDLGIKVEFIRSHQKYRAGFFAPAIERALESDSRIRKILETVSGHKLDDTYSPVQVMDGGYLKKRRFVSLDKKAKKIVFVDQNGQEQSISYATGDVKLDWRIDWPARWWLLKVDVEPAGRDHSSAGGSFDTGLAIAKDVFGEPGPLPVPYDFVNLVGDTKKMSASKGTGISATEITKVLPPEVVRFFMLRFPPSKRLYFDVTNIAQLIDEFAELAAAEPKSKLVEFALGSLKPVVSDVPFSQLVASYQSALKDPDKTIAIIERITNKKIDKTLVKAELKFIDGWLKKWAPDELKFELREQIDPAEFSADEKKFLVDLAEEVAQAPVDADGEWFHKAIYELKEAGGSEPKFIFLALYKALIGKTSGPRAGWFLSILPRDWLIKRLRLEA